MASKRLKLWGLAAGVWWLCGCASVVVDKAKLQEVRTVTVLGFFAPDRVSETRGEGLLRGLDDPTRQEIAEDALKSFSEAMARMGWASTSPDDLAIHPAYSQTFVSSLTPVARRAAARERGVMYETRYMLPSGLAPVWFEEELPPAPTHRRDPKLTKPQALAVILKDLKSDAAVNVQFRYCFRVIRRGMEERARLTAIAAMQFINSRGRVVLETPMPKGCGQGRWSESVGSVELLERDWVLKPEGRDLALQLFREASSGAARRLVDSLPVGANSR